MGDPSDEAALSFAQQRLWFLHQLVPGNPFYNLAFAYRLHGPLDAAALEHALSEIVARHEALRTRFASDGNTQWQVIDPPSRVKLMVEDVRRADDPVAQAHQLAAEEARAPFSLERGPLLRNRLVWLADDDHVLLVTMHHIVADGWSMGVFKSDLAALYRAFAAGEPSPLPPLEIQYADFAEWQRSVMAGDVLAEQLDYWRERLRGMPAALELPADRARPPMPSYTAGAVSFEIPADVEQRLRAIGADRKATLFMVLLAAFDALLAAYTGGTDIVVGTPNAGRDRAELEGLIGFFVNIVVLRVNCSGDPTFGELLDRVREATLGGFDHKDLPFERLVEELHPSRDPSRNPLAQIGFQLLQTQHTGQSLDLEGVEAAPFEGHGDAVHSDVELYCFETSQGLSGRLVYAVDLFDEATMRRIARHFVHILGQVHADPRLSQLSLLIDDEAQRTLVEVNDTAAEVPAGTVVRLFEAQAARVPTAVAVSFGQERLTYAELDTRANRLAHRLRSLGVGPEVLVGLCAHRGPDQLVGMLAILKAGGAYLPLDPEYPVERITYMLSDAACSAVIVEDGVDIDTGGAEVVRLDPDADSAWPAHAPAVTVSPDNLAYVIYTSGSTGRPKGAEITHRGVTNVIAFQSRAFGVGPQSRVLQVASICFDASVSEIWITLTSGGELVITPTHLVGAELADVLSARGVTQVALVPSVLATLPDVELPKLETIIIGGEAGAPAVVNRWAPGRALINVYGPTETTVNASYLRCAERVTAPLPIGAPVSNTQMYLLDAWLRPVPPGVPGEVYIGGAGVSRGFRGKPAMTASRFVANPFAADGSRLYRSGDLARFLPDGNIEFLGRIDDQVKVRGFRIELGEVESVLAEHPSVSQVSVVARDQRLYAYLVPANLTGVDGGALSEDYVRRRQRYFDRAHREGIPTEPPNPTAVRRVRSMRAKRLLEIGCGGGSLMRALAPACEQYVATDFSSSAIDLLRANLADAEGLTLMVREARDFRGFRDTSFNVVVVESVTQHCPTLSYVDEVVGRAVAALADGGLCIITDVRERSGHDELAIDARYFTGLPDRVSRVAEVETVRRGDRYDVVLTAGPGRPLGPPEALPHGLANDPLRAERADQLGRELREFAKRRLPDYMVPSGYLALDALPLSQNGKVDVRQLPPPERRSSGRAPASPEEKLICALFAEVLGLGEVSPDDGFFELGGHSLLAFRLVNLVRARFGVEFTLATLFTDPTPAALAHLLTRQTRGEVA
ncbi:non-ribosomal peptide synthetase [Micromonospora deserti]|nr:non-ribosomal peptide synthetase [Micromonospora deserti]